MFSFCSVSAQWNWLEKASLPDDGRESTGYFVIGTDLYVVCGRTSISPYVQINELWKYNSLTDTWAQKADFPGGTRTSPLAFAVDGKGYVMGGGYPEMHVDCWQYDPLTDTWTQKNDFPGNGRYTAAHFVLGSKVYMVGGYFNGTQTNEVWVYNSLTDNWSQLNDFPGGNVQAATGFRLGTDGYIVAGVTGHSNYVALKKAWRYSADYDVWDTIPSFPGAARLGAVSFKKDGKAYVGLGASAVFETHYNDFYGYDPVLNVWVPGTPLTAEGRRQGLGVNIGDRVFVGTGANGPWEDEPNTTYFNDLYTIDSPVGIKEAATASTQMRVLNTLVTDNLQVNLPADGEVILSGLSGQILWRGTLGAGNSVIPLQGISNGCYIVSGPEFSSHQRIIVAR